MVLPMYARLTPTQITILRKLIENGNTASEGEISEVGITPMKMEKDLNLNRKTLGTNLVVLNHFGLVERQQTPHGKQTWNYYVVSPIGEFVIKKNALDLSFIFNSKKDKLENIKHKALYPEDFQKIAYSIPLIKKHWDYLEKCFAQYPWRELHVAFSWVTFNVWLDSNPCIVSVDLTVPDSNLQTALTYRKFFVLWFKTETDYLKVEKSSKEPFATSPLVGWPLEIFEDPTHTNTKETIQTISEIIEKYLAFIFYYYFINEFEILPKQIERIKKRKISKEKKLEEIAFTANPALNPLFIHFTKENYEDMEKDINQCCKTSKKTISDIIKKDQELLDLFQNVEKEISQSLKEKPPAITEILKISKRKR